MIEYFGCLKTNTKKERKMKLVKYLKKAMCGLLALSLMGLAGCAPKDDKTNSEAEESNVPVIKWLIMGDTQKDLSTVLDAVNAYIEPKIGAKLDLQIIDDGSYQEKVQMLMASGGDFDICFIGYNNPYQNGVQKGAFLALDDYLSSSPLKDDEDLKDVLENARYDGKIYGIPNMQIMAGCTGLMFNKELAEEYGLDTSKITCLEDCEPYLEWVKTTHPEKYPFRTGAYGGGWSFSKLSDSIQGIRVDYDKNNNPYLVAEKDNTLAKKEAEKLYEWYQKGYIRKDVASVTDDINEYNSGKYALSRGAYKPGGETENNINNPDNQLIIVKAGKAFMSYDAGLGCMTGINSRAKNPEKAFKLIELVNTDPTLMNLLSYGVEGKHYTLEDGKVSKIENSGYTMAAWKFGNTFNAYLIKGQDDDVIEQTRALHKEAEQSNIKGFAFITDNVRTEIAQLATIRSKYKNLSTGAEDPNNYYDLYLAELERAGEDTLKTEIEKQLSEWQAK